MSVQPKKVPHAKVFTEIDLETKNSREIKKMCIHGGYPTSFLAM